MALRHCHVLLSITLVYAQHAGSPTIAFTATPGDDDDFYHNPAARCHELTPYLRRLNALTMATSVVGAVALVLCTLSVTHIIMHGRHKRSLPTRLVLGVLLSNLVFAITDMIPTNLKRLSGTLCGLTAIGPRRTEVVAGCFPNAVLFFGVYCTTMYELMMVLLTTHALHAGVGDIPARRERAVHLACLGTGVAALVGYYTRCRHLELEQAALNAAHGDRTDNWTPAQTNQANQLEQTFWALPGLLWGWALGPVAVALLAWVYQRLLYAKMMKEWRGARARNQAFDATTGVVKAGLDTTVRSRSLLLELQKQAHNEVVKPLEPYVVVIFAFSVPQIVGVTRLCQTQTQDAYHTAYDGDGDVALPCEAIVRFVMSFRPIALAMVYLWDPKIRAEAWDIPKVFRKLQNRRAGGGWGIGVRFPENELDGVALVSTVGRSTSCGKADTDIKRMGSMASKRLAEMSADSDCTWMSVDLSTAAVDVVVSDQDGGPIDPADSQIPYQLME